MVDHLFTMSSKRRDDRMTIKNLINTIDLFGEKEPDRPVYNEKNKIYTYGELKKYSDQVANYLQETVQREQAVVVYGALEFEMLVCFVGAAKAGNPYIPIDAHTPNERIEMILNVANPALIFSIDAWPEVQTTTTICSMPELQSIFNVQKAVSQFKPVHADETYYIIFTSGTTGVPKGVQISHDNLVSFVEWLIKDFDISEGMRFLAQAPYSFDLSVMSLYPALASGGSLTPLGKEVITDFKQLFVALPQLDIDVWVSTPSFMDICLMEPTFHGEHVPQLKRMLFCGEELPKATAQKLLERFPKAAVFNTYGPTEATVAVSGVQITEELLSNYGRVPIGYVKEDTKVYIMDEDKVIESDQVGEIIIVGPSVSKGYMNNPEKTQAAFFDYEGQSAYHTGDAGKLIDGMLIYEGRIDFQVKMHGYRIELEDIDHHLMEVSYVKQATVVPKYQNHKVQQLVAYIVAHPNEFDKEFKLTKAIKKELSDSVMDYMIPQKYIYVEKLPLTSNGKIDRKGLINEVNKSE